MRVRFSLRSLLAFVVLVASAGGLCWRWEPWALSFSLPIRYAETISFSEDGRYIVTTTKNFPRDDKIDFTAQLWDLNERTKVKVIEGHTAHVNDAVIFDHKIATASDDGTVRIWDFEGKGIAVLKDEKPNLALAVSPNLENLATLSLDGCRVYSNQKLILRGSYRFHPSSINAFLPPESNFVWFKPDSESIVFGQRIDGLSSLLLRAGEIFSKHEDFDQLLQLGFHSPRMANASGLQIFAPVPSSKIGKNGEYEATSIALTDMATHHMLFSIKPRKACWCATFSPDGRTLALGTSDDLQFWSRRRPERWWGIAWLAEFWLLVSSSAALVVCLWRDRRSAPKRKNTNPEGS